MCARIKHGEGHVILCARYASTMIRPATMGIYLTIKILFGNGKMNIHSNYNVLKINEFDFVHAFTGAVWRPTQKRATQPSHRRFIYILFWDTLFFDCIFSTRKIN